MPEDGILSVAIRFLREEVAPVAQIIDRDSEALGRVLDRMGELGLQGLKIPAEYGGPGLSEPEFRAFQEELAATSGTLAFLQTQHQSAASMIASSSNDALKDATLPFMVRGERRIGIGFSQLRRSGPPVMRAEECGDGYRLSGHVPWVTGYGFFPEFLIGAALPDGRSVLGIVPLATVPGVRVNPEMELAAMGAARTVTLDLDGFELTADRVAFLRPAEWIRHSDMINIALQGHFAIGCAVAGARIVRAQAEKKGLPFIREAAEALEAEIAALRQATRDAQADASDATTDERLRVRAWAIELAVRAGHAAITASSGAANSLDHPAQRVYREALVYTVSAQTPPIMEATLRRIASFGQS